MPSVGHEVAINGNHLERWDFVFFEMLDWKYSPCHGSYQPSRRNSGSTWRRARHQPSWTSHKASHCRGSPRRRGARRPSPASPPTCSTTRRAWRRPSCARGSQAWTPHWPPWLRCRRQLCPPLLLWQSPRKSLFGSLCNDEMVFTSPVAGLSVSNVFPEMDSTNSLLMNNPVCFGSGLIIGWGTPDMDRTCWKGKLNNAQLASSNV